MAKVFKYVRPSENKLAERASQQSSGFEGYIKDEYQTYRAGKGDHWLRILPPTWQYPDGTDGDHFGMDVWVHFGVGPDNGSVLCLSRMRKQDCPLCEARARAERQGNEEEANELKPIKRVLMWVIDRKEEKKGPVVWTAPWTIDRDLAKVCKDKQTGVIYYIDDPAEGFDISFEREGEGRQTKYTGLQLSRRPSSVPQKAVEYAVDNPLQDTLRWRTYDEIVKLYEGASRSDEEQSRRRDEAPRRGAEEEDKPARSQSGNGQPPWEDDVEQDRAAVGQNQEDVADSPRGRSRAEELKRRYERR